MKKILFVIDLMSFGGGAQKALTIILRLLKENGYGVKLLVLKRSEKEVEVDGVEIEWILEDVSQALLPNSFLILDKITNEAKSYDLLVSFMDFITCYFVAMSAQLAKIPYFAFVRCEPSFVLNAFDFKGINRDLYALCLQESKKVICNSKASCGDVERNFGVSKHKIDLLYNPIDFENIDKKSREIPRDFMGFLESKNSDTIDCFAMGRLTEQKNYFMLLEAFKVLQEKNSAKVRLFILGEGGERGRIEEFIQKNNLQNIHLLGLKSNVYQYLKYADIFIHTAHFEGFPNAVLEACALKKPLILSDIQAHKELFCDEVEALYFKDCEHLSKQIESLAKSEKKRLELSQNAFLKIKDFGIENFAKKVFEIFKVR